MGSVTSRSTAIGLKGLGAAAVRVRDGQCHRVKTGLLEDVRGLGFLARRAVAEVPLHPPAAGAGELHRQRRQPFGDRGGDPRLGPQLLAGLVGCEAIDQVRLRRGNGVFARGRGADGGHGHFPRIDEIHLVGALAGELDRLRPLVQAIEQVVLARLGEHERALVIAQRFEFVERRGLGHEVLEPLDAFRAFAVQHAALGPPENVLRDACRFRRGRRSSRSACRARIAGSSPARSGCPSLAGCCPRTCTRRK